MGTTPGTGGQTCPLTPPKEDCGAQYKACNIKATDTYDTAVSDAYIDYFAQMAVASIAFGIASYASVGLALDKARLVYLLAVTAITVNLDLKKARAFREMDTKLDVCTDEYKSCLLRGGTP